MAKKRNNNPEQAGLFKREIPKMPEGYYSGDKPNPNLRAFVEAHLRERPYDPETDDYDVPAFDKPIETTKATAIYNMHTYWSKKPHDAIRQYIRHYTKPGDLVLDPFCGSGGTALAALMEGRKAIAIDRSPAATFITKNYCTPVDVDELYKAFEQLKRKVKPEIDWLYETRCDRCGGKATTAYTVYSQVFQCPRCLEKVPLFDCVDAAKDTKGGKQKKIKACPHCYKRGIVEEISPRSERFGAVPVLVSYICEKGCKPKRDQRRHNDSDSTKREYFEKYDLGKIREIEAKEIPYWYPKHRMMHAPENQERWGLLWRPYLSGIERVCDFYTTRNLHALASVVACAQSMKRDVRDVLMFMITSIIQHVSKMATHKETGGGFAMGTYYVGSIFKERNVLGTLQKKFQQIYKGLNEINVAVSSQQILPLFISTDNACSLGDIPSASIDYIFTDPPYSWKVQYGESNFLWEAWLNVDTHWLDEEIIVNEIRGKSETDWANMMRRAMAECHRVLKPGRWLSLCYHDTSEGTWALIQDIMAEVGFIPDHATSAVFIETGQKAWKQVVADKINKRDLVINFRKPKPGEAVSGVSITGEEDETTFNEKVCSIIRDYLETHPGSTKDRIYDEVVSRMVRAGCMEAHNFDELLRQVADEVQEPVKKNLFENEDPNLFGTHRVSRWYLKETEFEVVDAAESAKEDAAAEKIRAFIVERLKENPSEEGVHYSDLFEHYVYTVKDKPRRPLAEWLLDYFYKTDAGTYRLPASEEEERLKVEGRAKGTQRRIKRYLAYIEQGVAIPDKERPNDATLAEWIRHCKRSGLYEQGKLLYEKGGLNLDNLPEEAMVNVEEDYQVCVRMLARSANTQTSKKAKRGRQKKSEKDR